MLVSPHEISGIQAHLSHPLNPAYIICNHFKTLVYYHIIHMRRREDRSYSAYANRADAKKIDDLINK
jgi:hypothetical protein